MAIIEHLESFAMKKALGYMDKDPKTNIPKLLDINANGDIEPCAFIHYSDSNIREKTLLEAYRSPLFMGYHDNQPWNENMLRPCPVLDNPGRLTQIVVKSGAKSTDYQNLESVQEFSEKCVETAENWAPVAERLWKESQAAKITGQELAGSCSGCGHCTQREEKAI